MQVVAGREHDAPLLGGAHAGGRPAEVAGGALAHFHEDHRAAGIAHHQVDLAAAAAGRPIIAREQLQPGVHQVGQGAVFGGIAGLLGGLGVLLAEEFH